MGRLSTQLKICRRRWLEIKDGKKYFSICQLALAEIFRYCNLILFYNGIAFTGLGSFAGEMADDMDTVTVWVYSNGSVAGTERNNQECVCLCNLLSLALALAGFGMILAAGACWFLSWLFLGLSCLWCFRTDSEFEISHAIQMEELQSKRQRIVEQAIDPRAAKSESAVAAFEAQKVQKLAAIDKQIAELEEAGRKERQKRFGEVAPNDIEAQAGPAYIPDAPVPTNEDAATLSEISLKENQATEAPTPTSASSPSVPTAKVVSEI